jgi:hypothetical protein
VLNSFGFNSLLFSLPKKFTYVSSLVICVSSLVVCSSGCTSASSNTSDLNANSPPLTLLDLGVGLGVDLGIPSKIDENQSLLLQFNTQEATHLVVGENWQRVAPSQDPFSSLIQDRIPCDWTSFGVEYGGIEVNTGRCGYVTLTQNLLAPIQSQSHLKISAWHTPLLKGDQQGDAFFSLMVGDQLVWEKKLRIPSDAISWEEIIISSFDVPEGTPLFLNVRNHGANSWVFYLFQVWTPTQ